MFFKKKRSKYVLKFIIKEQVIDNECGVDVSIQSMGNGQCTQAVRKNNRNCK